MPITRENCQDGTMFHHNFNKNQDGTCERWRRNGKTKTWKTRPNEFVIPVKYGLRDFAHITNFNAHSFHAADDPLCPQNKVMEETNFPHKEIEFADN